MDKQVSAEEYLATWSEHVKELSRLGWHLNQDEFKQLKTLQEKLMKLVVEAAADIALQEQQKANIGSATKAVLAFCQSKESQIG